VSPRHQADLLAEPEDPVDDADIGDDPLVVVELRVEDQGTERRVGAARGGGDPLDDGAEDLGDAQPRLGADGEDLARVDPQGRLDLLADLVGARRLHVDLVQGGDDRQVAVDGQEGVGDGLRLDPLGGVDEQDRPLAGREAPRDLVVEVDVAGGVDQVQLVLAPVERVVDRDGACLDGDPPLALQVHVVEQLLAELAHGDRPRLEQELVGQRALAVIDVRHDREVAMDWGSKTMNRGPSEWRAHTTRRWTTCGRGGSRMARPGRVRRIVEERRLIQETSAAGLEA
jgi:hypothetical protein